MSARPSGDESSPRDKCHVTRYNCCVIKTFAEATPGNRLHALERERQGQHSISVNDQWRICFRFDDGDAYDVEITDYH